jgi:transcriptional regulator with XRE-family HTH domain
MDTSADSLSKDTKKLFAKNFNFLYKKLRLTHELLAEKLGGSRSSITSYGRSSIPRKLKLVKLLEILGVTMDAMFYTDLTLEQGGKKSRKVISVANETKQPLQSNVKPFVNTGKEEGAVVRGLILAAAGYTQMPEVEEKDEMSTFQLPFLSHGKNYWGFIIQGESMQDIQPGTFMVGELIENWHAIKSGTPYILQMKNTYKSGDGFVLKLVYNFLKERGEFELRSTNPEYESYTVPVEEIRRIWRVDGFYTRDFPGIAS